MISVNLRRQRKQPLQGVMTLNNVLAVLCLISLGNSSLSLTALTNVGSSAINSKQKRPSWTTLTLIYALAILNQSASQIVMDYLINWFLIQMEQLEAQFSIFGIAMNKLKLQPMMECGLERPLEQKIMD